MRTSVRLAVRISPEALRRKIRCSPPPGPVLIGFSSSSSGGPVARALALSPAFLPLRQMHAFDDAILQSYEHALQQALRIDAAWIDADRLPDLHLASAFVDVAVQAE